MKHVVNSDMVCHLWANQSQPDARNTGGSIFFRDSVIYSYGLHFPMAKIVKEQNGQTTVVLVTTKTYSNTTAKHMQKVRSAIRHLSSIECRNVTAHTNTEHQANLQPMREACYESLDKATRSRSYTSMHMQDADHQTAYHLAYRTLFGLDLDTPLIIAEDWKTAAKGRVAAQSALNKERKAQAVERERLRLVKKLKDLEEWKVNTDIVYRSFYDLPVALRLNRESVNTSRGASIPTTHAQRLWKKVKAIRAGLEQPYYQNEHTEHAGPFAVNSIDAQGTLIAGCHTITFEAMQEFAERAGW